MVCVDGRPKKKPKEQKRAEKQRREEEAAARRIQAQARGRQARRRRLAAAADRGVGPKMTDIKAVGGHQGAGGLGLEKRQLLGD